MSEYTLNPDAHPIVRAWLADDTGELGALRVQARLLIEDLERRLAEAIRELAEARAACAALVQNCDNYCDTARCPGGVGKGGSRQTCKLVARARAAGRGILDERGRLRTEISLHKDKAAGQYWAWQGDEEDRPESLTCPILIAAADMRDLLADRDRFRAERNEACAALEAWRGLVAAFLSAEYSTIDAEGCPSRGWSHTKLYATAAMARAAEAAKETR